MVYNTYKIIEMNRSFSVQIALKIYKQGAQYMYKYLDKLQHSFLDFNQPLRMHMNPENRWLRLAEQIFDASTLVLFRKRLSPEIIMEANDYILNQQISFEAYNNTDRIEVKREFSVEKHSYGLGLIITKLEETQLTSTALSVFTANLFKMQRGLVLCL